MRARVALIGANGHGLHHRRQLASLRDAQLVALCDTAPVIDPPADVPVFHDPAQMLSAGKPDVVIVSTPPPTHLPLAVAALRAGADVFLEKPPVLNLAEHDALTETIDETGRAVQVGFQALASPELPRLRALAPCDVSVLGAWQRDDAYWSRSPWAGRLPLDGALRNPFAHALMQSLAIQASEPVRVEVAWCRIRPIEVDDTATLRVTCANGGRILIAVTLAGEEFIDSRLRVGAVELDYRVGSGVPLLENLLAHRSMGEPLLAPLAITRGFTAVVEALATVEKPGVAPGERGVLHGVNEALTRCVEEFALLNEIDIPWAATVTGGTATIG
ncbi:MAG TPA: gfo/Idh/MocA family oxidoreductase [Micromonosporaceae bacterium]|nr:gfo/Idh/MocA family oxidoreductase [Micromonosporaceae bacterium]